VDYGNMVYFEALLEKMHKDANEVVDPVLIPNLFQLRGARNSPKVFSFHEADYHNLDLCFPDPFLLDVVEQSDNPTLEFSELSTTLEHYGEEGCLRIA
jgi:hypothetical protein